MKRLTQRFALVDLPSEALVVRHSPDGGLIALGSNDGNIRVYHPTSGSQLYTLPSGSVDAMPVTALRWRPGSNIKTKNMLLSASADGSIKHWHRRVQVTSQRVLSKIAAPDQIYCLDVRVDGEQFAAAGRDKTVRLFDDSTGANSVTFKSGGYDFIGHSNRVFAVKFDPADPNRVWSGGWDNTVICWDARSGIATGSLFGPHICGDALDVYGNLILTGSWRPDKQLQLWDVRMIKNNEPVVDVPWTGIAVGSGSSAALASRIATRGTPTLVYAAAFSPSGNYIAAGGSGSNECKIFDCSGTLKECISVPDVEAGSRRGVSYAAPVAVGGISSLTRSVYSISFDPADGIAVGGGDFMFAYDLADSASDSSAFMTEPVKTVVPATSYASVANKPLTASDEAALLAQYGGEEAEPEDKEDDDDAAAQLPGARFGISEASRPSAGASK